MNQRLSILTSVFLGLSLGAGGTAIGNNFWVRHTRLNGKDITIGLWRWCEEDGPCQNTFDRESIKDNRT